MHLTSSTHRVHTSSHACIGVVGVGQGIIVRLPRIASLWAILTPLGSIAPHGVLLVGAHARVHLSSRRLTWR